MLYMMFRSGKVTTIHYDGPCQGVTLCGLFMGGVRGHRIAPAIDDKTVFFCDECRAMLEHCRRPLRSIGAIKPKTPGNEETHG